MPFVWEHWDTICTKRSKSGSWKSNLATKLVRGSIDSDLKSLPLGLDFLFKIPLTLRN